VNLNFKKKISFILIFLVVNATLNIDAITRAVEKTWWSDNPKSKQFKEVDSLKKPYYSINLMWINRSLNKNQPYIHPAKNEPDLWENFLNHIFKWANVNPDCIVNVWFDSVLTATNATKNTWMLIENYVSSHYKMAPITLRDVRTIPKIIQNAEVFSDKTPVYFRVDLLRLIIALHIINKHEASNFVYGDLDIEPISEEQLFDAETIQNLQKYGIVMAHSTHSRLGFENGFQIISNNKHNLLEAIEWAIVTLNIQRAYNALLGDFCQYSPKTPLQELQEIVYMSYESMFKYFYHLEGYGKLKIPNHSAISKSINTSELSINNEYFFKDYDKERDLFQPFGLKFRLDDFIFDTNNQLLLDKQNYKIYVPTKKVNLPPTRGCYD
jgi:hypothetical protein